MLPNTRTNYISVVGIELDHEDRFMGLQLPHRFIRIPYYEINQVSIYERRISVQYKKTMNAIYRAEPVEIRHIGKEFERAGLGIHNKG